jgi:hypothetical protein
MQSERKQQAVTPAPITDSEPGTTCIQPQLLIFIKITWNTGDT